MVEILLSTVTDEFRTYRDRIRDELQRPNVTVHVQEDFIATGTDTLAKLDGYIRRCDAVIHLAGDMTGAWADEAAVAALKERHPNLAERLPALRPSLDTGEPRLSYTQWEACLAVYHGKTLVIAVPDAAAARDQAYVLDPERRSAQQAHLQRLRQLGRYSEITFANADQLAARLLRSAVLELLVKSAGREIDIHADELPFLVDRQPQIARICTLVRERLLETLKTAGTHPASAPQRLRPSLFILPARRHDAPDTLARRLAYKDGPEYCRFDGEADTPGWVWEDLNWTDAAPDAFAGEFGAVHSPAIENALAHAVDRWRPACFSTVVWQASIENDFHNSIDAWVNFWNAPPAPAAMHRKSSRPAWQLPIIGLLIVVFESPQRRSWLSWGSRRPSAEKLIADLEALARPDDAVTVLSQSTRPIALPRLSGIREPDAMHWLGLPQVRREKLDTAARSVIQKMFENAPPVGVPMEAFADEILACKRKADALARQ